MKKIKLLLAEDHPMTLEGIKTMIKKSLEFSIVAAVHNGKEAIDYLNENPNNVDGILMDINMPEMNGVDATQIITEKFKNVKILGFTDYTEEKYITDMVRSGALGCILKDAEIDELILALKTVANNQKYWLNRQN
jgi:DNA-binding NarL/FixJ family response regulator